MIKKKKLTIKGHEYVITKLPNGKYAVSREDTRNQLPRNIFKSFNDMINHYPNLKRERKKLKSIFEGV